MPETETPTPTPSPSPTHPAFNNPPASSGNSMVQITAEELNRLLGFKTERDTLLTKHAADVATKEAERLKAIAEKGGAEKALEAQRQSYETRISELNGSIGQVREKYHGKAKSETITASLAGIQFSGDTPEIQSARAAQFRANVEGLFETYEDNQGNLIVREKGTGRPAADVMKELLNAPVNQHFFAPKSRGGAGTDGTRPAGNGSSNPSENPHPVGTHEWAVWNWQQGQQNTSKLRLKKS